MTDRDPQVTVVIPTYNRIGIVNKAIDSAMAQSRRPNEIIVVDDGSTDGTGVALQVYGDQIRYIFQENKGVSVARNTGIQAARGDWIAFLDSDDEWLPDKLAVQMNAVLRHPEIVAHATNSVVARENAADINMFEINGDETLCRAESVLKEPLLYVLGATVFFTPAYLVRRDVLIKVGMFDSRMTIYEDLDLFARVALEGPWASCCQPLVRVLWGGVNSLSSQYVTDRNGALDALLRLYSKLALDPRVQKKTASLLKRCCSGTCFELGTAHLALGNRAAASRYFMAAFGKNVSLRSCAKSIAALLLGSLGVKIIEAMRRVPNSRFRRSDSASQRAVGPEVRIAAHDPSGYRVYRGAS